MIITVPEYKKIQHISKKTSKLNESLFDDFDDDFDDETDLLSKNIISVQIYLNYFSLYSKFVRLLYYITLKPNCQ